MSSDFERLVAEGEALPVAGWNAGPVRGRWLTSPPPWDYDALVRERRRTASSLLDLGTGGGEWLSAQAPLPRPTYATEGYPPNLSIARARLEPLGVRVLAIRPDQHIDLPSGSVELVTCRHEAFDADEVRRVLRPGGAFLTQQVGADNYGEITRRFEVLPDPPTNAVTDVDSLAAEVAAAGLRVVARSEARWEEAFRDIGALVWYLRFAPWQVPGFSARRFRAALEAIDAEIGRAGPFRVGAQRLLVSAVKD